jgi:hypothetical protein
MQSTLKRESKEPEIVESEAIENPEIIKLFTFLKIQLFKIEIKFFIF